MSTTALITVKITGIDDLARRMYIDLLKNYNPEDLDEEKEVMMMESMVDKDRSGEYTIKYYVEYPTPSAPSSE